MTLKILNNLFDIIIKELKMTQTKKTPFHLLKKDVRGKVFAIEGVLRLYAKTPPKEFNALEIAFVEKSLLKLKSLEDHIGEFAFAIEGRDYAKKLRKNNSEMEVNIEKAKNKFLVYLENEKTVKDLEKIRKQIQTLSWPKKDKKFVKSSIKKEVKRIDKKIKERLSPLIFKKKYSSHEIEEGLHEWRRMIRWISIYIQAYTDYFYLKSNKEKLQKNAILVKKYQHSPFCQLKGKDIKLSAVKYYKLSDYILKVGDLKTKAELDLYLIEKYKIKVKKSPIEQITQKMFSEFIKDDFFKKILK